MPTILVLDDNLQAIHLFEIILEQLGFQVVFGHNGNEGLGLLETLDQQPVAIISDLRMPFMDGFSFLQHIRRCSDWQAIPFILTTPIVTPDVIRTATEYGADGFLPKPFTAAKLKSLLSKVGVLAA